MMCRKASYESLQEALQAIREIKRDKTDVRGKRPKRAYVCPSCGRWHLTSMDKVKHVKEKAKKKISTLAKDYKTHKFKI